MREGGGSEWYILLKGSQASEKAPVSCNIQALSSILNCTPFPFSCVKISTENVSCSPRNLILPASSTAVHPPPSLPLPTTLRHHYRFPLSVLSSNTQTTNQPTRPHHPSQRSKDSKPGQGVLIPRARALGRRLAGLRGRVKQSQSKNNVLSTCNPDTDTAAPIQPFTRLGNTACASLSKFAECKSRAMQAGWMDMLVARELRTEPGTWRPEC